jgi:hypothetical protein
MPYLREAEPYALQDAYGCHPGGEETQRRRLSRRTLDKIIAGVLGSTGASLRAAKGDRGTISGGRARHSFRESFAGRAGKRGHIPSVVSSPEARIKFHRQKGETMITLAEAKLLKPGEILLDSNGKRWKVNGKVQTWKRNPLRIRIPLKHGLYSYGAITEADFFQKQSGGPYTCDLLSRESV